MIFIRQWLIANAEDVPERNSCPVKWFVAFILGIVLTISTISTAKFINRFSPEGSKTRCGEMDSQRPCLSSYGLFSSKILFAAANVNPCLPSPNRFVQAGSLFFPAV